MTTANNHHNDQQQHHLSLPPIDQSHHSRPHKVQHDKKHHQSRLHNSVRLLMQQASEFQQLKMGKLNQECDGNNKNNNHDITLERTDTPIIEQNHPLKQAGVVLQQQFRGLRKRVKSARVINSFVDNSCSHNSENCDDEDDIYNAYQMEIQKDVAVVSPPSTTKVDDELFSINMPISTRKKLTPKKKPYSSPIPKHTIKITLQESSCHLTDKIDSPESLPEAICIWLDACHQLVTGPEMIRVLHSTGCIYIQCMSLCIKTITLPVTLPIQLGQMTLQTVSSMVSGAIVLTSSALVDSKPLLLQQTSGQDSEECNHGVFDNILSIPGNILGLTGKIATALVAPVLNCGNANVNVEKHSKTTGLSSSQSPKRNSIHLVPSSPVISASECRPEYLERLRLDYVPSDESLSLPCRKLFSENHKTSGLKCSIDQSDFLLRVNDLNISCPTDDCTDIYYIDLSPKSIKDQENYERIQLALDRFVLGALALLSNHPTCHIIASPNVTPLHLIHWHPEGATKRILRELEQKQQHSSLCVSSKSWTDDVLIWSGRFQTDTDGGYGRKHGFFLARGFIPMSPHDFVRLLWDNSRTSEYNNFCLGRSTVHGVSTSNDDDESFLNGSSHSATKIIRSEMRVPFAGITVKAICLMHVRPLETGDGYIICSRSLDVGPSGVHTAMSLSQTNQSNGNSSPAISSAKNEILWGVNIIQSVQSSETSVSGTKLTSLSQVGSAVPSFLAQKIGLMGISDFFKNVRKISEKPTM